jgi:hypothetical protein
MRQIAIGTSARNAKLFLTPELRQGTHMHVVGGSGTGKSKFLEWLIRQDILAGHGLCLIDWHGTLYRDVLAYCSRLHVGLHGDPQQVVLINPSRPDFITGFNPFMNQGADISVQVANRVDATVKPWGASDTDQMPTFEFLATLLYTFAIEQGVTLPTAAQLLLFSRPRLRQYATRIVSDTYIRDRWEEVERLARSHRDWQQFALSTNNRVARFLSSRGIRRFIGLRSGNLDLMEIMDQGKILLVNLGASDFLDRKSAKVFAALFLNEFFETAMRRAERHAPKKPPHFLLYLDEFQNYITDDIADMLDQVRKGGLHLVLAHQHVSHLLEQPTLKDSVLTNARIRAVFGGLPYESACEFASEMFLPDLNTRQIKKAYYHTIHLYREEQRAIRSRSTGRGSSSSYGNSQNSNQATGFSRGTGSGLARGRSLGVPGDGTTLPFGVDPEVEGWFVETESENSFSASSESSISSEGSSESFSEGESEFESEGETSVPVWVPIPIQELGSESEWSVEEKRNRVAEMLKCQQQAHCFIKLDTLPTQPLKVPFVRAYDSQSREELAAYERAIYQMQEALPASRVDQLIEEDAQRFLAAAEQHLAAAENVEDDTIGRE